MCCLVFRGRGLFLSCTSFSANAFPVNAGRKLHRCCGKEPREAAQLGQDEENTKRKKNIGVLGVTKKHFQRMQTPNRCPCTMCGCYCLSIQSPVEEQRELPQRTREGTRSLLPGDWGRQHLMTEGSTMAGQPLPTHASATDITTPSL